MQSGKSVQPVILRRSGRGFSLVELLVVIGIIALLMGILIPVLGKAKATANRMVCLSNVRQLHMGILMYCDNNHGYLPTCAKPADSAFVQLDSDWIWWEANRDVDKSVIAKSLGVTGDALQKLLRCPADLFEGRKTFPGIARGQGPHFYSYAMNESTTANAAGSQIGRTKLTDWRSPATKILVTEPMATYEPGWGYADMLAQRHGTGRSRNTGNVMAIRASTVFMDGHAEGIDDDWVLDSGLKQMQPDAE